MGNVPSGFGGRLKVGLVAFNKHIATEMQTRLANRAKTELLDGSGEQQAIWDVLLNRQEHVIVEAVAGSGKTTTLLQYVLRLGNKADVDCMTYHSLGFKTVKAAMKHAIRVDQYKVLGILDGIDLPVSKKQEKMAKYRISSMVSYAKTYGHGPSISQDEMERIADRHDVDLNGLASVVYDYVPKVLKKCADELHTIDFDDMVWLPMHLGLAVPKYDVLCVDEYQDTAMTQQWLAVRGGKRVVAVGDKAQCLTPGTAIEMTGGVLKPIEDIQVGEEVVTYHSGTSTFRGLTKQGRKVEAINRSHFDGSLYVLEAGKQEARCTPNHKWLVRMVSSTEKEPYYILYLMKQGTRARIGICKGQYRTATTTQFGATARGRSEEADAMWVLNAYETLEEARIAELIAQSDFGLPSLIFRNNSNPTPSQDFIDRVYEGLGDLTDRADDCLRYYDRDPNYPAWTLLKGARLTAYSFVTEACNIIPGYMQVKLFEGNSHGGKWRMVRIRRERYKGDVIGLQVEPTEGGRRLYIANGIVSHNSIYSFRGCDGKGFDNLRNELQGVVTLPLTLTRRCPKAHVRLAQSIVPQIKALDDAPEGIVRVTETLDAAVNEMRPGDLVVCRVNAELIGTAYKLLKRGVKAVVRGKDIGQGMVKLIEHAERKAVSSGLRDVLCEAGDLTTDAVSKFNAMPQGRGEMRAANAQDRYDCVCELATDCKSVEELKAVIEKLFAEFEDDGQPKHAVVLGTVHRTKGLEGNRVFILRPDLIPHPMAKRKEDQEAERNLAYVAVTRAKFGGQADTVDEWGKHAQGELIFVGCECSLFPSINTPVEESDGINHRLEWMRSSLADAEVFSRAESTLGGLQDSDWAL